MLSTIYNVHHWRWKDIRIFTTKSREEIESLEAEHAQAPHLRILQKALAADITARVHSEEELQKALQASQILFGQSTAEDLKGLDARTLLDVFEGVPQMEVQKEAIQAGLPILEVLCADTALFASRGEAKKLLAAGGVSLNKSKVDAAYIVTSEDIIGGGYLLAQKGKKNYALIVIK